MMVCGTGGLRAGILSGLLVAGGATLLAGCASTPVGPPVAYGDMGVLLQMQGREQEAEQAFRRALQADPKDGQAHNNYARLLAQQGRHRLALRHWRETLRHGHLSSRQIAQVNLARLAIQWGDLPGAKQWLHRVLSDDPGYQPAIHNLQWLHRQCNQVGMASSSASGAW